MSIKNLKINELLGIGYNGAVYSAEYENKKYALKINYMIKMKLINLKILLKQKKNF